MRAGLLCHTTIPTQTRQPMLLALLIDCLKDVLFHGSRAILVGYRRRQ